MLLFNGAKFVETLVRDSSTQVVQSDVAVFVASWEARDSFAARAISFRAKSAVLLSFENDEVPPDEIEKFLDLLRGIFESVTHRRIPSATNRRNWGGEVDRFVSELSISRGANTIAVDYTCLPKAITQTLFRAFIRKSSFAKTIWIYSLGKYEKTLNNLSFSQGVKDFFPIRHTPGDGGMSTRRVAIVGLGSDEGLIIEFLEQFNFDRVFALSAFSAPSPELLVGATRLRDRLVNEGRVLPSDFIECDASSVVAAIDAIYGVVSSLGSDTSVDIFSAGPKSHSVAACVVAEKFKSVRLMGREASRYARYDVIPEGTISLVEVVDYKNPSVRNLLEV